jgi:hypothetical protein
MMIDEFMHMTSEDGEDPIAILMIAGILREDFPWLAEVMTEAYREIRDGDAKTAQRAVERLHRFSKNLGRRKFMMEFAGPSEDAHILAMEMPRMLDHLLHRIGIRRISGPDNAAEDDSGTDTTEMLKG